MVQVLPSGVFIVDGDFEVPLGTPITFFTNATDNIGVEGVQLFLDEVPVTLTANGVATYTPSKLGTLTAKAVAYDAAGNLGESSIEIRVYDPNDLNPPIVELSPTLGEEPLTDFTDIIGTVTDDNLTNYVLSIAPASGGEFVEIASGNSQITNGKLGDFDPTLLQNDTYILRLTATDESGNSASTEQMVDVTGELKLGNFRLSFTDLEVPVAGIPINLTRTYDTLNVSQSDDFGYGWRLEFRDTDLRTSVGRDELYEQMGIPSVGFEEGTRVYVTLPGGKRTGFTFKPVMDPEIIKALRMGAPLPQSMIFYNPAFETDDGEQVTLSAQKTQLLYNQETGQYYHPSGSPYNPANSFFGGSYTLTTKEGVEYEIDGTTGDLLTVTDTNGNTLTYSDEGIFSSTGKSVTFERNASGRIVAAVDPEGERIEYEYDENGDLVGVTDREENTTKFEYHEEREHYLEEIIDPLGRTGVRTEYDESGRLKRMLDVNGEAVELVYDPDNSTQTVLDVFGNPTTYVYDERGNILTEVNPFGKITERTYDEQNHILSETIVTTDTDEQGNSIQKRVTTSYTYDAQGNQLSQTDPLGNTYHYTYNQFGQLLTSTDPLGNTTTYTFDSRGNVLSKTDAESNTTTYTYDGFGNPLTIEQGENDITRFEYDQFGNQIRKIDALGNETTFTYDASGNVVSESTQLTTPDGIRTLTTTKTYDAEGNVTSELNAEGGLTQYEYDANGNKTAVIDALGRRTEMRYNDKDNLIETILPDATPDNFTDNLRIKFDYDEAGNRTKITDPEGQTTLYEYDRLNRSTGMILPDDTPENLEDNPRIKIEYNQAGEMTATIDPRGNRTEYQYDLAGQMSVIRNALNEETAIAYDVAGREVKRTNAKGQTTLLKYNKLGQLVETIFPDETSTKTAYDAVGNAIASTDQEGRTTRFEYDALDQLIAVIDANQQRTEYQYDEAGNLVSQRDALGHVTQFEYDGLGQQIAVVRPELQRSKTFYDPAGNVERSIDFNGKTIEYDHDELNRLLTKRFVDEGRSVSYDYTPAGRIKTVTDERGLTSFNYNERGLLDSRTEPDGTSIFYTYNPANLVESVTSLSGTIEYRYDELNRLDTAIGFNPNEVTTYQYDSAGNLETVVLPNGVTEMRGYDKMNRLTSLVNQDEQGNVVSSYVYTLDKAGHKKTVEESDGRKVEYTYDELYRLTKEEITDPVQGNRTIDYAYDVVGNRLTRDDSVAGETTYVYDNNDRLLSETTAGVTTDYSYDKNGNTTRVAVVGSSAETIYEWDGENRLRNATAIDALGGTNSSQFWYDVNGLRVASVVNGEETRYLLDTSRPHAEAIEEYAPDGEIKVSYVHGLDLISRQSDENSLYYLQDGHSGVRQLSNGLGGVTDFYNYDAYGRLLHSVGGSENNYLYRGEQFDPNVGLQYLRSRYYNPDNGRFASVDPFEGLLAKPMSRHRYLYGNANPVTYLDPSGEFSIAEVMQTPTMAGQLAAISHILPQAVGIGGTIGVSTGVGWLISRLRRGNWREWSGKANASTITPSGLLQSTIGVPVDPTFEGIHIEASTDWDESSVETGYTKIFAKWLVGNLSLSAIGGGSPVTIPTSTDGDDFVSYTKQELGPNPLLLTPFTLGLEFNFIAEGNGGVGVSSFLQGVGLSTIYSNSPPPGLFAGVSAGLSILMPGSVKYERGRPTPDDP